MSKEDTFKYMYTKFKGPKYWGWLVSFFVAGISNMHLKFYIAIQLHVNLKIEIAISREWKVSFLKTEKGMCKFRWSSMKYQTFFWPSNPLPPVASNSINSADMLQRHIVMVFMQARGHVGSVSKSKGQCMIRSSLDMASPHTLTWNNNIYFSEKRVPTMLKNCD